MRPFAMRGYFVEADTGRAEKFAATRATLCMFRADVGAAVRTLA